MIKTNFFKRVCSGILIISLFVSSQTLVYAQKITDITYEQTNDMVKTFHQNGTLINEWVVEENENGIDILRTEDYPNGDACSFFLKEGKIMYSSYLDRSNKQVTDIDYITGEISTTKVSAKGDSADCNVGDEFLNITTQNYEFTDVGTIFFSISKIREGETQLIEPQLLVERSAESGVKREDIYGKYKNKLALISKLASLFSIPAALASPVAATILKSLGILSSAVEINIPTFYVRAAYNTISWHGKGFSLSQLIEGTHYTFYYPDSTLESFKEDDYYPIDSFNKENMNLATKLGKKYYPGYTSYIVEKFVR